MCFFLLETVRESSWSQNIIEIIKDTFYLYSPVVLLISAYIKTHTKNMLCRQFSISPQNALFFFSFFLRYEDFQADQNNPQLSPRFLKMHPMTNLQQQLVLQYEYEYMNMSMNVINHHLHWTNWTFDLQELLRLWNVTVAGGSRLVPSHSLLSEEGYSVLHSNWRALWRQPGRTTFLYSLEKSFLTKYKFRNFEKEHFAILVTVL